MLSNHPLGNLTIEEGVLWEVYTQPPSRTPYMNLPSISIKEKKEMKQLEYGMYEYTFLLNAAPDSAWVQQFAGKAMDVTVYPGSEEIKMKAVPEHLPSHFEALKLLIARANQAYQVERLEVIDFVNRSERQEAALEHDKSTREKAARESFDSLEV